MTPEYVFPDLTGVDAQRQTLIQAWFLGAHLDVGGSTERDGLSLYPLQWMLLESKAKGLVLDFEEKRMSQGRKWIDNPLDIVFPQDKENGKTSDLWSIKTKNGLRIEMQDLRGVHYLPKYDYRYGIRLNRSNVIWMKKESRTPFDADGDLEGFCRPGKSGRWTI